MAVYYCSRCGNLKDNDYCVGSEDPDNELELVCEDCMCELEDEDDN